MRFENILIFLGYDVKERETDDAKKELGLNYVNTRYFHPSSMSLAIIYYDYSSNYFVQ